MVTQRSKVIKLLVCCYSNKELCSVLECVGDLVHRGDKSKAHSVRNNVTCIRDTVTPHDNVGVTCVLHECIQTCHTVTSHCRQRG